MIGSYMSQPEIIGNANWTNQWAASPIIPGDWFDIDPANARELLVLFVESLKTSLVPNILVDAPVHRLRAMPTRMYPGWLLVECQIALQGKTPALFCFIFGPDGAALLDGTAVPIHALNKHLKPEFTDPETCASYLQFYCSMVRSDRGRFEIIGSLDDLALQKGTPAARRKQIKKLLQPLGISEKTDKGLSYKAVVRYGDELFNSAFIVLPDGLIEMTDDEQLLTGLPIVQEICEGPFRVPGGSGR